MRHGLQRGFTLIELMIVIAIIGILAAIAIPAYQDYTIRSQVTEGVTLASGVQVATTDYYASNGTWPTGMTGGGTALNYTGAVTGNYVTAVATTAGGKILITYGNKANAAIAAKNLEIYAATTAAGDIAWICGKAAVQTGSTSAGGAAADTTITDKYLPKNCQT